MKLRSSKSGFTLIELLVVVAIIALLIAILLPSLARAKANAVRVKCGAQLKQWGVAVHTYAAENENMFGVEWSYLDATNTKVKVDWVALAKGVQTIYDAQWSTDAANTGKGISISFRTCPGDPVYGQFKAAGAAGFNSVDGNANVSLRPPIDYAMPRYIPVISNGPLMWKMTNVSHPSISALMLDVPNSSLAQPWDFWNITQIDVDTTATDPTKSLKLALLQRHLGVGNVLFLDGHVETHNYQDYLANIPAGTGLTLQPTDGGRLWTSF